MSHEPGDAHDPMDDTSKPAKQEQDIVDMDQEVDEIREDEGYLSRAKQGLSNWFRPDNESEDWGDQQVGETDLSRRGFLTGTAGSLAALGAGGYAVAEATDGDGADIDWNSNGDGAPAGGAAPGDSNGGALAGDIEDSSQYAFSSEEELMENTDFCYPGSANTYIAAIDADTVEEELDEGMVNGDDPTGALSYEEIQQGLEDITPHQGMYAVDVDRKAGNNGDYGLFVQLVGEEDGGTYVTREGAMAVDDIEVEEAFEGYQQCN